MTISPGQASTPNAPEVWKYEVIRRNTKYILIIYKAAQDAELGNVIHGTRGSVALESKEELDKWTALISMLNS